ncbi:MAG: DUF6463 family protein [Sphingomonas sp.]
MAYYAAWTLIILGILHVIFGVIRFKLTLRAAFAEGFFGKFAADDSRRLAFWFIMTGPLLSLIGQLALRAAQMPDVRAMQFISWYILGVGGLGVATFPKSPLWSILPVGFAFLAVGYGWAA